MRVFVEENFISTALGLLKALEVLKRPRVLPGIEQGWLLQASSVP